MVKRDYTGSSYLLAYISCMHCATECPSLPVIQRRINSMTLLSANLLTFKALEDVKMYHVSCHPKFLNSFQIKLFRNESGFLILILFYCKQITICLFQPLMDNFDYFVANAGSSVSHYRSSLLRRKAIKLFTNSTDYLHIHCKMFRAAPTSDQFAIFLT